MHDSVLHCGLKEHAFSLHYLCQHYKFSAPDGAGHPHRSTQCWRASPEPRNPQPVRRRAQMPLVYCRRTSRWRPWHRKRCHRRWLCHKRRLHVRHETAQSLPAAGQRPGEAGQVGGFLTCWRGFGRSVERLLQPTSRECEAQQPSFLLAIMNRHFLLFGGARPSWGCAVRRASPMQLPIRLFLTELHLIYDL